MKKILLGVVVIGALAFAYYTLSPFWRNIRMDEASPLAVTSNEDTSLATPQVRPELTQKADGVVARAPFIAQAHEVEGQAQLIKVGDDYTVRFENYKAINGPDLRIYLATDITSDDFVELGKLKATEGNVNYPVPAGTDLSKYDTVLVWCKAFGVLFSYAQLGES